VGERFAALETKQRKPNAAQICHLAPDAIGLNLYEKKSYGLSPASAPPLALRSICGSCRQPLSAYSSIIPTEIRSRPQLLTALMPCSAMETRDG